MKNENYSMSRLDSTAVSIFVDILVELTNIDTVFVIQPI